MTTFWGRLCLRNVPYKSELMKPYFKVFLSFLILALMAMCKHEPTVVDPIDNVNPPQDTTSNVVIDNCDPDSVYFENEILPIFISSCALSGCHDANSAQNNVVLTDYSNIIKEIVPNNLDESKIYEVITETDPDKLMPLGGPALDSRKIELIGMWIQQGAPNNNCKACDTSTVSFQNDIFPLIKNNCQSD